MKSRPLFFGRLLLPAAALISFSGSAHALSGAWEGSTDDTWAGANWSASPVPGPGEIATFNASAATVFNRTTIDLGAGVTIGTIVFDTANAAAYIIGSGVVGSQTLTLDNTGAVTMNPTVANNQLFNSNTILGTAIAGTTTITNSSTTNSLNFAGAISGGTGGTAGAKTINIAGGGAVNFSGAITAGGSTGVHLLNTGSGTTTLSGSGTSNFLTLRATTTGTNNKIVVDGQTVNVSAFSGYTGTARFDILSGAVNFNGGLGQTSTSADAGLWKVSGGAFSASFVTIGRNGNPTAGAAVASTQGLVVTGGTANITGNFSLGTNNSGSTSLVDGGALTVGGEVRIGAGTTSTRFNILEVRSGSLTSTDATNGIILSRAGSFAQNAQLLLTGGTTTAEKITFGTGSTFAGSTGHVILNGSGASLYLGSGGMVNGAGANITTTVSLQQGTLGAKADWSSSLNMSLAGSGVTIKAADASNVARNITLSGVISGANGFIKSGDGTLTLSNANTYFGATTINGGTVALDSTGSIDNTSGVSLGTSGTFDVSAKGGYTVNNLTGSGDVIGAITISTELAIGNSPGTTDFSSDLTLGSASTYTYEVDGGGTAADLGNVAGNLIISDGAILDLVQLGTYTANDKFTLFAYTGTVTGTFAGLDDDFTFTALDGDWKINYNDTTAGLNGGDGTSFVTVTAIPEPASALLGGIGMLFLLRRRRNVSVRQ